MQQRPQTAPQAPLRLRFAPIPTRPLHVGGARTALFNWLLARKLGGTFVLRIEDSGVERCTEEWLRGILADLRWLGLHWDQGPEVGGPHEPYQQTLRQVLYHAEADHLLHEGKAYYCFCTRQEIDAGREAALRAGKPPRYDGRCRQRDPAASARLVDSGRPAVVRLAVPAEGEVNWMDLVRGESRCKHAQLDDFVLLRADGNPSRNLAVVVDDAKMAISHVVRADTHLSRTPRQLVLYDALGYPRPEFAHLPALVGPDRTRLSQPQAGMSVARFRDQGILPQAVLNCLALLGWSYDGEREIFTPRELVTFFDLKNVGRNPVVFEMQKLQWMNCEHFARLSLGARIEILLPQMKKHGLWPPRFRVDLGPVRHFRVVTGSSEDKIAASIVPLSEEEWMGSEPSLAEELPRLKLVLEALGSRLGGPHEVAAAMSCFYTDDFPYDPLAVRKHLSSETAADLLEKLGGVLEELPAWTLEAIEAAVVALAARLGVKAGRILRPARVALTGRNVEPGVFEVLYLLGRAKSVQRLRCGREIVRRNRELPAPGGSAAPGSPPPGEVPPPAPPGTEPAAGIDFAIGDDSDDSPPDEA